ncbi:MAG TPA: hypothetical protein VJS43_15250 [Candidatus Acidoferrales bacterium]|nr:hypothetical protein [Candidatus Acidoferrales bacterium]
MRFCRILTVFLGLTVVLAYSSVLQSDQWDKTTKVTFNAPTEVPGTVLQPGTYTFKLADSNSDRHIVQIFNEDHTKLITTILAIPNERLTLSGKTVLTYNEHASGQPAALEAWFYPGDNFGQQFVYPRSEALQLARLNNEAVPSTGSEEAYPQTAQSQEEGQAPATAENTTPSESAPQNAVAQPQEQNSQAYSAQANPAPASPAPEVAQNNPQPQARTQAQSLPQTASWEPLIGMMGLALIGVAAILRRLQRA